MKVTREQMRQQWLEKKRRAEEEKGKDPVEIVQARVAALPNAFQERASKEQDRRADATDSRYWVAMCFQTSAEKEQFLINAGLADLALDGDYLDGSEVAKRLDVELTTETPQWRDAAIKKKLADLT
ncbi:hypothetical protein WMF38_57575 [Sorangium sp. So ce118]